MPLKKQQKISLIVFFSVIILFDQFWKLKIRQSSGFFVCNKGISFNLNIPYLNFWLIFGFLLIFSFLIHDLKKKRFIMHIGIIFLLAGAFSNILDRILMGCVMDFLSPIKNVFPLFNLADVFIFLGCLIIFIFYFLINKEKCV